tara:strand:- start:2181 stop:4631 length:2451 start_codon:yes stop_codon:yes gene_type:complete
MGGLGGHMAHLSEDVDLTFNEIVDILGKVANAEIENVTEKVDGQNLFLSWTVDSDGNIRAARGMPRTARNASDIKKGGMSTEEYVSKWRGHPAESAFTNGFKAIAAALRKLSPEDLETIFADGKRYVNMEIMYPKNPNIILYSSPNIVLHGLQYFGEEETPEMRQLTKQKFSNLSNLVDGGVEQVGDEEWSIHGPKIVALKKLADGSTLEELTAKIEAFAAPVGMNAQVRDYVELVVRKYAQQVEMPEQITNQLILLMLDPDEAKEQGITVVNLKKGLPKELQSVISRLGAKTNSRKYISSILQPLEIAISDFAIEVLRGVKSYFVSDNDKEVARMRAELEKSIAYLKALQTSGDEKMGELVDKQLAKLGAIENLASSMEGVVFEYPPGSDRIYKLTGAFAMANQIIGRARRSGMTEAASGDFTIRISKDREMTKTIDEWLAEIKAAKHEYTKLPQSVYEDVLSGTPLVDIVEEENALPTVYNAVMGYVNGLLTEEDEEEIDIEFVDDEEEIEIDIGDDESDDPVVDSDFPKTVAIVPGAFKPPHKGHLGMVRKYLAGHGMEVPKADEVIILVSNPTLSGRPIKGLPGGTIDPERSIAIWRLLLAGMPGVKVMPSSHASPLTAAYESIGESSEFPDGTKIILGASTKDDDWRRWVGAEKYLKPGLSLINPEQSAVVPNTHEPGYVRLLKQSGLYDSMPSVRKGKNADEYHASDMRYLIELVIKKPESIARKLLESFVGEGNVEGLLSALMNNDEVNEISAAGAGGGSVAGFSGPIGVGKRDDDEEDKEPSIIRHENIDLSIVDDVIRLIMEKGIMQ